MASFGKCKLCDKEGKLISAHIIPRIYFEDAKGQDESLKVVGGGRSKKSRTGIYDDAIVCQSCENDIFSPLDDYGRKVIRLIHDTKPQTLSGDNGKINLKIVPDVDYLKLKRFLASVLWRASVSRRAEYKGVALGRLEPEAKNFVEHSRDNINRFQVCAYYLTRSNKVESGERMLLLPHKHRVDDRLCYHMIFGGLKFFVSTDSRGFPTGVDAVKLQEGKAWCILEENSDSKAYLDIFRKLAQR